MTRCCMCQVFKEFDCDEDGITTLDGAYVCPWCARRKLGVGKDHYVETFKTGPDLDALVFEVARLREENAALRQVVIDTVTADANYRSINGR